MSPSCSSDPPIINFTALESGASHRHQCFTLRNVCLFNGTLYPHSPDTAEAAHAKRIADSLIVRSQFGSHRTFAFSYVHPLISPPRGSPAAALLSREPLSSCDTPLVWVPTWAFSFADSFVSSLLPIDELQSAGLIDERVLLRPDLWAWPRSKNPIYRMIGALSSRQIRSLRESAPICNERAARRNLEGTNGKRRGAHCMPQCYEKLLLCNFKSTFDTYESPMAPWRAAQRVGVSVLSKRPVDTRTALAMIPPAPTQQEVADAIEAVPLRRGEREAGATPRLLRVLFVNRTRTKFPRSLYNLRLLLQRCENQGARERWAPGWRVRCTPHEFGAGSLADDVRAARSADVLVGTHGAGLANAFFLPKGGSLVEVRPYNFEGPWPDKYFRALTSLERSIHYYQVTSGSASLSIPTPLDNVSVWDARDHAVRLPWRTLVEVLKSIIRVNGGTQRYLDLLWTKGVTFVSHAHQL